MLNRKIFREFHTDKEAYEWAMDYFGSWIKDIQSNKDNDDENDIAHLLYDYTGNMNIIYNEFLRDCNRFNNEEIKEYSRNIVIIAKGISKFALEENIIVYRYTHKNLFRQLFDDSKLKIGKTFTDKGFMSTTLVQDLLKEFAKNHRYNCVLKLYLPKGTKGAYIKFDNSLLNEHEFLLPPNTTFKLLRRKFSIKYFMWVYECKLVSQ
ncbi:ADP-ribosyltransferase [Clostridium sp. MB40-C1]|uniref:ADP-ribosyltransferase n=1 Tax=Clostridium sp. MB40-C1 TaxID=3070996 RepID=UPI0027E07A0D|nr:ADP-ribosyltransferase [Clostridium sp. MB40-C1]WMJ81460.1 ADP-ribosyltransferase [Clostridium sp. MB40-C1]